jgi:hypothetical protein
MTIEISLHTDARTMATFLQAKRKGHKGVFFAQLRLLSIILGRLMDYRILRILSLVIIITFSFYRISSRNLLGLSSIIFILFILHSRPFRTSLFFFRFAILVIVNLVEVRISTGRLF